MNAAESMMDGNWLWGSLWVVYACFYGLYFSRMARRLRPDAKFAGIQGSPERLANRRLWCYRFAGFMFIPTALELVRPTNFTGALISIAPCAFGLWVMRAIWKEIFRSKMPISSRLGEPRG